MRRQIELPKELYHITKYENVKNILSEGLIPRKSLGAAYTDELTSQERCGVFLTTDPEAVLSIDASFSDMGDLVVFEVDISGLELMPDTAYDGLEGSFTPEDIEEGLYDQFSYICEQPIPPSRLNYFKHISIDSRCY